MTLLDLLDTSAVQSRTAAVAYACPSCPNRVTLYVEHYAPTCANRHDQRTMNREENAR